VRGPVEARPPRRVGSHHPIQRSQWRGVVLHILYRMPTTMLLQGRWASRLLHHAPAVMGLRGRWAAVTPAGERVGGRTSAVKHATGEADGVEVPD
jgi:hypothetical protein